MDKHIASMLSDGWEIMSGLSHYGNSRGFLPFAKRDTITVSFERRLIATVVFSVLCCRHRDSDHVAVIHTTENHGFMTVHWKRHCGELLVTSHRLSKTP
ncbi:MAG TPA: hypothetical protein VFP59_19570 [Candidatus Angelobacter sp.]|nr:hypothetical protein [Candidatus Angelobacter sp.]